MRESPCIRLEAPRPLRVEMLAADYAHFTRDGDRLQTRLTPLAQLHGKAAVERWKDWARSGATNELTEDLLDVHYDPSYQRAIQRNFPRYRSAPVLPVDDATHATFHRLARQLLDRQPVNTSSAGR
jgi:tRNA 2-selenouridine synthase